MRRSLAVVLLVALGVPLAFAKQPRCTFRLHCEANAHDSDVFATQFVSMFTHKPVVMEKTASITELDVAAFYPIQASDGTFGAVFQLNDHGRLALDTLSVERRGTFLHVFVNGRPAAELQIDRRVADGRLYIASGFTAADIETMRKDWPPRSERTKRS